MTQMTLVLVGKDLVCLWMGFGLASKSDGQLHGGLGHSFLLYEAWMLLVDVDDNWDGCSRDLGPDM